MQWFLSVFSVFVISMQLQAVAAEQLPASRNIGAPTGFAAACAKYNWLCHKSAGQEIDEQARMSAVIKVNRAVNGHVMAANDRLNSGQGDLWTLPVGGRGDCEDYALQKMKDLIDEGFPSNRLALSVVIGPRDQNHVVLIARMEDSDYVLDNLTNAVKPWKNTRYTFLATQDFQSRSSWRVTLAGPRAGDFS